MLTLTCEDGPFKGRPFDVPSGSDNVAVPHPTIAGYFERYVLVLPSAPGDRPRLVWDCADEPPASERVKHPRRYWVPATPAAAQESAPPWLRPRRAYRGAPAPNATATIRLYSPSDYGQFVHVRLRAVVEVAHSEPTT